jgi:hypothetical protein
MNGSFVTCALLLLAAGDEKRRSTSSAHDDERFGEPCGAERYCERARRGGGWYERGGSSNHATVCRACFRD